MAVNSPIQPVSAAMIDPLLIFSLSLIIVVVFVAYIFIQLSKFSVELHQSFASSRKLMSQVEEQDKEIFHQNESLVEVSRNNLNQMAVINGLLTKIKLYLSESLEDEL